MQRHRHQHALPVVADRGNKDRPAHELRVKLRLRQMLVLEAKAIEFEGRRRAVFETLDHGLAAARITAHRIDGDGIVRRQQPGIHERPQQRHRAGRIAARVRDFPRRPYLVGLVRREFRKAIGPVGGDAKGGRCVQHLGGGRSHAVDQRNRLSRGLIGQAEDDEVHFLHQRALGPRILALCPRRCS